MPQLGRIRLTEPPIHAAGFQLLFNDTFSGPLNTNNWKVLTGDGSAVRHMPPASGRLLRPPRPPCTYRLAPAPPRAPLLTPNPGPAALLPLQLNAKGFHDGEKQVYTTTNAITTSSVLSLRATKSPSGGIYSGRVHSKRFWMPRTENGQYNIIRFETRFRVAAGEGWGGCCHAQWEGRPPPVQQLSLLAGCEPQGLAPALILHASRSLPLMRHKAVPHCPRPCPIITPHVPRLGR